MVRHGVEQGAALAEGVDRIALGNGFISGGTAVAFGSIWVSDFSHPRILRIPHPGQRGSRQRTSRHSRYSYPYEEDRGAALNRREAAAREPVPFEMYEAGVYLHGTKADLVVGDLLLPGRESNFEAGRVMNYVYFTATLDAAVWGAELAVGDGPGRIYIVEPTGAFEDDPNLTDKKFPGNPTQSFRTRDPIRVVGELVDWVGHQPEKIEAMRAALDELRRNGLARIED